MTKTYKLRVHVEIVESAEVAQDDPVEVEPGHFEVILDEKQALNIDECEQALLRINYPALRTALSAHLTTRSLEKARARAAPESSFKSTCYRVDGEVGRFTFETHQVVQLDGEIFDTRSFFPHLTGQEWYRTAGFKELGLLHGTIQNSFRQSATGLNRWRHQLDAGTPWRTLSHASEQEGSQLLAHLEDHATAVLLEHEFTGTLPPATVQDHYQQQEFVAIPAEQVQAAITQCAPDPSYIADMAQNPIPYEVAARSVQVSIDPVGVKHQKVAHDHVPKAKTRDMVYQTVAHIQHAQHAYHLNGAGIAGVLRLVLAFLLQNTLLKNNLIFFIDGERSLSKTIQTIFAWFGPLQLILDWPHLQGKCRTQLSMALTGREIRNRVLAQLSPLLWAGCVDRAIQLLRDLDPDCIKDARHLDKLIGYFERQRPYIPCYAVRKELGLRNSSNRGEKANDLLVSQRQKHNGMSWSASGSLALAALTTLVHNNEYTQWFRSRSIRFAFAA